MYVIEKRPSHGTINLQDLFIRFSHIFTARQKNHTLDNVFTRVTTIVVTLTFIYLFCNIRDTFRFSFVRHALRRSFLREIVVFSSSANSEVKKESEPPRSRRKYKMLFCSCNNYRETRGEKSWTQTEIQVVNGKFV